MSIKSGIQTFKASIAIIALATGLVACPPPPPVLQVYSATLVNQIGTNVTGTANATLNNTTLEVSGDILNATTADTFTAKLTCSQTQNLSIGIAAGQPKTLYGTLSNGTTEDKTVLESNGCIITVSKPDGTVVLKGNLKH